MLTRGMRGKIHNSLRVSLFNARSARPYSLHRSYFIDMLNEVWNILGYHLLSELNLYLIEVEGRQSLSLGF